MSIRLKLLLLASLVTLVCGLGAGILIHHSVRLHQQVALFLPATQYLSSISQTQTGISRQMKEVLDYILSGDPTDLGEFRQENKRVDEAFASWLDAIQQQITLEISGEEEDLVQVRLIQHHHQLWVRNMEEVVQLAEVGRRTDALEMFGDYSRILTSQLFPVFSDAINDGITEVEESYQGLLQAVVPLPWVTPLGQKKLRTIRATIDEVVAGHRINTAANRQYVKLMQYVAIGNPDALAAYQRLLGQLDRAQQDFLQAERFKKGTLSYNSHESNLLTVCKKLETIAAEAIRQKQALQTEAAIHLLADDFEKNMSGIFLPKLSGFIQNRSTELVDLARSGSFIGLALIALTLILVLALTLRASYKVIHSLNLMQRGIKRVAGGDYQARIELKRRDEFGAMAQAFNQMTAELQGSHQELEQLNRNLEQQVSERTAQLEGLNQELKTFNAMITHDLRSPLNVIHGISQLLQEKIDAAGMKDESELLARIVLSSMTMSSMLEALQQLGAISERELRPEPVDLSQMVLRQILECQTATPGRELISDISPGIRVVGDASLLLVAISNLVGNAWKFSAGRNPARIAFAMEQRGAETVCYLRDNGIGFPGEQAADIFSPFRRLHKREDFPGTGLGLATVAKVMNLHGWRIWAESAPDQGTTIFFTCRLAAVEETDPEPA